ncbi:MAG: LysM peptidoglycan-binding domain-containing protein [Planctomycetota bacterium]
MTMRTLIAFSICLSLGSAGGCAWLGPAEPTVHRVEAGDSLTTIALQHYGDASKWSVINEANPHISPNKLSVGDELVIPETDD